MESFDPMEYLLSMLCKYSGSCTESDYGSSELCVHDPESCLWYGRFEERRQGLDKELENLREELKEAGFKVEEPES